ncbi:MAG: hypothetical protein IJU78_00740 [Clostridia bacterium]|nr:hypothetical protein [Clostridia bacterium]
MKSEAKERVYLLIIVFCLLMCAVLIVSVLTGRPVFVSGRSLYEPPLREQTAQLGAGGEYKVTEELLAEKIKEYLPDAAEVKAEIYGSGSVNICAEMSKKALKELIKQTGTELTARHRLAMLFLPSELTLKAALECRNGEDGMPELRSCSLWINEKSVDVDDFEAVGKVAAGALASALRTAGDYRSISFADGAITVR